MPTSAYDLPRELSRYTETWGAEDPAQTAMARRFAELVATSPRAGYRDHLPGHLTASALIVTPDIRQVLLTHHAKLNLWLQLGGHADGDPSMTAVALKEGEEESGLNDLRFLPYESVFGQPSVDPALIFDLDCHWIPERKSDPGHYHYDVRFVLVTAQPDRIAASHESHEIRWFALDEAYAANAEASMHRQFDKLKSLRNRLR